MWSARLRSVQQIGIVDHRGGQRGRKSRCCPIALGQGQAQHIEARRPPPSRLMSPIWWIVNIHDARLACRSAAIISRASGDRLIPIGWIRPQVNLPLPADGGKGAFETPLQTTIGESQPTAAADAC